MLPHLGHFEPFVAPVVKGAQRRAAFDANAPGVRKFAALSTERAATAALGDARARLDCMLTLY